jgi:VanZ family protein
MKFVRSFSPAIVWGTFIFAVILIPGNFIPHIRTFSQWLQWDKVTHLVLFGVFSISLLRGFSKYRLTIVTTGIYLVTFLISVVYGGLTECLQFLLPVGRDGNIYDFYANTVGTSLGCLTFFFLVRK